MLAAAADVDVAGIAPLVHTPTLLVNRIEDPVWPLAEARRLASLVPAARLIELPGADHAPWSGESEAVLSAIQSFVKDVPTAVLGPTLAATVVAVQLHDERPQAAKVLEETFRRELARHRGVPLSIEGDRLCLALFD